MYIFIIFYPHSVSGSLNKLWHSKHWFGYTIILLEPVDFEFIIFFSSLFCPWVDMKTVLDVF